jgi:hypothetical protein
VDACPFPSPHDAFTLDETSHSASSLTFACSSSAVASCFARAAFCMKRRLRVPLESAFPAIWEYSTYGACGRNDPPDTAREKVS